MSASEGGRSFKASASKESGSSERGNRTRGGFLLTAVEMSDRPSKTTMGAYLPYGPSCRMSRDFSGGARGFRPHLWSWSTLSTMTDEMVAEWRETRAAKYVVTAVCL